MADRDQSPWRGWIGFCRSCRRWQEGDEARPGDQDASGARPVWLCASCDEYWGVGVWPWACPAHAPALAHLVGRLQDVTGWHGSMPCAQRGYQDCTRVPDWLRPPP
jgi:hypothetical protein